MRHPYLKHNMMLYTNIKYWTPNVQTPTFYTLINNSHTLGTRKFRPTSSCNLSKNSHKSTTQQHSRRIYFKAPISEWVIFIYRQWRSLRKPKTNNTCIDSLWEKSVDDCSSPYMDAVHHDNDVIIFAASIYLMYNIHMSGFMCEFY